MSSMNWLVLPLTVLGLLPGPFLLVYELEVFLAELEVGAEVFLLDNLVSGQLLRLALE